MKQRMHNVFTKKLKNKILAGVATNVGYTILVGFYAVVRLFLHQRSDKKSEEARERLNNNNNQPEMNNISHLKKIKKDLSIIVSAYNAEKTIQKCIDSVICEKTKYQYELIIVNDGSTDNTRNIIENIHDEHMVIIHQNNRGFSGARNRGIEESVGKYIMFLDSDDYLVGNAIDVLMDAIIKEDAQIVQGNYFSFWEEEKIFSQLSGKVCKRTEEILCNPGFPWAKIYSRHLFEQVRFPIDLWFEDTIVCMLLYRLCTKMVIIEDVVYAYRINPEGITQKARHNQKCVDHYWVMEFCLEMAQKIGLPNDEIQYGLVSNHMSSLLYRRISLMNDDVIESAFILACDMLDEIRPDNYSCTGNFIQKDIERAFNNRNYKLWKMASFVV